jgi:hypothetical protein
MKFHEHVDTTYPKINYKLQLLTRQNTRDMAHTNPPNGSNSESRWGARTLSSAAQFGRVSEREREGLEAQNSYL